MIFRLYLDLFFWNILDPGYIYIYTYLLYIYVWISLSLSTYMDISKEINQYIYIYIWIFSLTRSQCYILDPEILDFWQPIKLARIEDFSCKNEFLVVTKLGSSNKYKDFTQKIWFWDLIKWGTKPTNCRSCTSNNGVLPPEKIRIHREVDFFHPRTQTTFVVSSECHLFSKYDIGTKLQSLQGGAPQL